MNSPGPLGFITPRERDARLVNAHEMAMAHMPRFALQPPTLPRGGKVALYEAWRDPLIVAEVGMIFPRFRQLTGSCVGVGGGCCLFTLAAIQRKFTLNPTQVFIPWWGHPYGKSRLLFGDRTPGEGSMGSTFAQACREYGVFDHKQADLPAFDTSDGLALTSSQERQWSDGDSPPGSKYDAIAKQHLVGSTAEVRDVAGVKAAILNGYPITWACNNFIGNAKVKGSGADAAVVGYWDGRGGHQQSVHGVWDNPTLGPLYWAQNTWGGSTYPTDPAGGPICGCWVEEAKVEAAFRLDAEVYAFSSLSWFPANPALLDWALA